MARYLCFPFVTICTVVLMATRSSAQNCYMATPCTADSYSASRCGERTVPCNISQGCISTWSTVTALGINTTTWEKGCAQGPCPTTPTCTTLTVFGVDQRACIACCRGNLCNTGSPPSSSSVTGSPPSSSSVTRSPPSSSSVTGSPPSSSSVTGSPPSSSSVTFPFSPPVMSLLTVTVVFMIK